MVKHDLTNSLIKAFPGISNKDMSAVVDALLESMTQALMQGEAIELRGLGRFKIKERRPIKGRNPKTETPIYIPKRWIVSFKPSESLSKRINQ